MTQKIVLPKKLMLEKIVALSFEDWRNVKLCLLGFMGSNSKLSLLFLVAKDSYEPFKA